MKIDLVITELETGGAEKCCFQLAHYLLRAQHDARIISIGPLAKPPKDSILRQAQQAGIPVLSMGAANIYQLPKAWFNLRKHLQRDPPDIAQSLMWHANVLAAAIYPNFGVPLIGGNRVLDRNPSRLRSAVWASKRMAKVVAVSREVARWTHEAEKVPLEKILTIPNGLDLEGWRSQPVPQNLPESDLLSRLPKDAPVLLVVGRMNHQKGTDILAARTERLLLQLPEHHLVLLGDGPYRPLVESVQSNSQVGSRIHLLGVIPHVKAWMERSQLLLLPSRYEGMPNVVLEAMASNLPVATVQVEGIEDLLGVAGESLQVASPENWDQWCENAIAISRSSELQRGLADRNRSTIERSFQLDALLGQYESLYRRVCGGR